ncbi:MAG: hypothetical protein E5V66_18390 [Mesorhizobium sp.]|nr:hypothetical protein EOA29_24990 [Mesorhizobium sp. M1E.F.Ca.ET.063.01.1.1]TIW10368.1 MAG: hypothetical protein E5V66_18390 [Mesorhizobium sp.]
MLPPIYVDRARNAELWDVEGRRYIDFVGGMGADSTTPAARSSWPTLQAAQ